jgi:hypothetical protein
MDFVPIVVSYYTKNTVYEQEAQNLICSCEQFGIDHLVEAVEDLGSWEKNCAFKPYFLQQKMKELQRPLLWVDADAMFLQKMKQEPFMEADLAAFCDEKRWDSALEDLLTFAEPEHCLREDLAVRSLYQSLNKLNTARFSVRSGTVYINATSGGRKSLEIWCRYSDLVQKIQKNFSHYSDGISLYCTFLAKEMNIVSLPVGYCKIFDKEEEGLQREEIVIEHYQASRKIPSHQKKL